jgi:hypothetical protein
MGPYLLNSHHPLPFSSSPPNLSLSLCSCGGRRGERGGWPQRVRATSPAWCTRGGSAGMRVFFLSRGVCSAWCGHAWSSLAWSARRPQRDGRSAGPPELAAAIGRLRDGWPAGLPELAAAADRHREGRTASLRATDLRVSDFCTVFLELHSTTQTVTTCMHTHPYEHTYANPTPRSTSDRLSTR